MRLIDADALKECAYLESGVTTCADMVIPVCDIDDAVTVDAVRVVRCKDCIYWQNRQIKLNDGSYRDYLPDDEQFVAIDIGINVSCHCTLHGFEDSTGSWFWAKENDFCSKGKRMEPERV